MPYSASPQEREDRNHIHRAYAIVRCRSYWMNLFVLVSWLVALLHDIINGFNWLAWSFPFSKSGHAHSRDVSCVYLVMAWTDLCWVRNSIVLSIHTWYGASLLNLYFSKIHPMYVAARYSGNVYSLLRTTAEWTPWYYCHWPQADMHQDWYPDNLFSEGCNDASGRHFRVCRWKPITVNSSPWYRTLG